MQRVVVKPPIQLAVLGAGLIGKRHIEHINTEPEAELYAVVDPAPAGQEIASALGVKWYPNFATIRNVVDTWVACLRQNGLYAPQASPAAIVKTNESSS
jgi:predicted dehydrogenase